MKNFNKKELYLFSKAGFSDYCKEQANSNIHLVTFEDIVKKNNELA